MNSANGSQRSIIFTVSHPEEEAQKVLFERGLDATSSPQESFMWSDVHLGLLVSFNAKTSKHSVWKVNQKRTVTTGPTSSEGSGKLQTVLTKLWSQNFDFGKADKILGMEDNSGHQVLVLFSKSRCTAVVEPVFRPSPARPWRVESAMAVELLSSTDSLSTWSSEAPRKYLLVLSSTTGQLSLHHGKQVVWTTSVAAHLDATWQDLAHGVGDRVTLVDSSGKSRRFAVKLQPKSGLVNASLAAIQLGCQRLDLHPRLLSKLLEGSRQCLLVPLDAPSPRDAAQQSGAELEWQRFCQLVRGLFLAPGVSPPSCPATSAWEKLLQSGVHRAANSVSLYSHLKAPEPSCPRSASLASGNARLADKDLLQVLECLHAVYEDLKLDLVRWRELPAMGELLCQLAAHLGEALFVDYYLRDHPHLSDSCQGTFTKKDGQKSVPSILCHLASTLSDSRATASKGFRDPTWRRLLADVALSDLCFGWARRIARLYELLAATEDGYLHCVAAMPDLKIGLSELDRVPPGVALPLRQALAKCRDSPPTNWPASAYILIGRQDLISHRYSPLLELAAPLQSCRDNVGALAAMAPYSVHGGDSPLLQQPWNEGLKAWRAAGDSATSADGEEAQEDGMRQLFESQLPWLRFGQDLRLVEVRRMLSCSKLVSVHVGTSLEAGDPDLVNQQQAQLLTLSQRTMALPAGRGALTFATFTSPTTEALPIPEIVLTGRLPAQHNATVNLDLTAGSLSDMCHWPEFHNGVASGLRMAPEMRGVTATWIGYNRPEEPSHSHAGFLLALGLTRHLTLLPAHDLYRYLSQEHDPTTIAMLLGMAAARAGSMDPAISKMLYLHIPTKHPPSFPDLELTTVVQSAALVAVGLLYQGTAHRLTTEILLEEIDRRPNPSSALDREGYALAAGFALGLVTLGRGRQAWGLSDLRIEDKLHRLFASASESETSRNRSSHRNHPGSSSKSADGVFPNSSQVLEGAMVNLDITAPGAILALCLMYLKSNDRAVATFFHIPSTQYSMEYVRPDFLLLRVVSRNLILWDSVEASMDWVQGQIPAIMHLPAMDSSTGHHRPLSDRDSAAQCHASIIAGACMALGLRFAGTGLEAARKLLHHYALFFLKEKRFSLVAVKIGVGPGKGVFEGRVDPATLEAYLDAVVLSLSIVMAGSGDLDTLRLLRFLRRRNLNDGSISYGNSLAISQAIGFLFLGGGRYTFDRSNKSIAALLMAIYPRFPPSTADNRCHLQALRHMWALAAQSRCLQAVDADHGTPLRVAIDVEVEVEGEGEECAHFSAVTPCLLPERAAIKKIQVVDCGYWGRTVDFTAASAAAGDEVLKGGVIAVKRRSAAEVEKKVQQLADPALSAFSRLLLGGDSHGRDSTALQGIVSAGQTHLLQVRLLIQSWVSGLENARKGSGGVGTAGTSLALWNIRALWQQQQQGSEVCLLDASWLAMLAVSINRIMESRWEVSGVTDSSGRSSIGRRTLSVSAQDVMGEYFRDYFAQRDRCAGPWLTSPRSTTKNSLLSWSLSWYGAPSLENVQVKDEVIEWLKGMPSGSRKSIVLILMSHVESSVAEVISDALDAVLFAQS